MCISIIILLLLIRMSSLSYHHPRGCLCHKSLLLHGAVELQRRRGQRRLAAERHGSAAGQPVATMRTLTGVAPAATRPAATTTDGRGSCRWSRRPASRCIHRGFAESTLLWALLRFLKRQRLLVVAKTRCPQSLHRQRLLRPQFRPQPMSLLRQATMQWTTDRPSPTLMRTRSCGG